MRVLAVTGTRADWGLLAPVLTALREDTGFQLELAATGQHLMSGSTSLDEVHADHFEIAHRVDMQLSGDDSAAAVSRAMGAGLAGFGQLLAAHRPDLMLVLGDRYEILGAVCAALLARVPVAHLCGGDVTEGAIDDSIRHAITKMSHLHFVSHAEARDRVIQLGEQPENIYLVGSPGLDRIRQISLMGRNELLESVWLQPCARNLLITFHPVTLADDSMSQCLAMLEALAGLPDTGFICTGSNADPEGRRIDEAMQDFVARRPNAVFHASLGSRRYFSALAQVDAVVGNSSSGLYEAPSFKVATVNIGDRQKGRPRAASVIDCDPETPAIRAAIDKALGLDCCKVVNPYGDGHTADRVRLILSAITEPKSLLRKRFTDLPLNP